MNVGYCKKCHNVEEFVAGNTCTECGGNVVDLGVTSEEWNSMGNSAMVACIQKALEEKKPIKQPSKTIKPKSDVTLVSGICPQCGGKIKVDKKQEAAVCEHCGTPFIVEKAINIVNNNIQVNGGEAIDEFVDKIKDRDATLASRVEKSIPLFNNYFKYYQEIINVKTQIHNQAHQKNNVSLIYLLVGPIMLSIALILIIACIALSSDPSFDVAPVFVLFACFLGIPGIIMLFVGIQKRKEAPGNIDKLNNKLRELAKNASNTYQSIMTTIPELPKEYYYPAAINYINKVLKTNRADNMRQALAMLDEETHRWKMEAMAKQNLTIQQQQNAALNAIWWQNFLRG